VSPAGNQFWKSSRQHSIFGRIGDQWVAISSPDGGMMMTVMMLPMRTTMMTTKNKFSRSFSSETLVDHIIENCLYWNLLSSHIEMGLFISLHVFCEHFILYITGLNVTDNENCYQHYFWKLTRREQTYK